MASEGSEVRGGREVEEPSLGLSDDLSFPCVIGLGASRASNAALATLKGVATFSSTGVGCVASALDPEVDSAPLSKLSAAGVSNTLPDSVGVTDGEGEGETSVRTLFPFAPAPAPPKKLLSVVCFPENSS